MISLKQWCVLLVFYLVYLLGGGIVFLYLESGNEIEHLQRQHDLQKRLSINIHFIEDEDLRDEISQTILALESLSGSQLMLSESFQQELVYRVIQTEELQTTAPIQVGNSSELLEEVVPQFNDVNSNYSERREELFGPHPKDHSIITDKAQWSLWNSFFFSFTAITTIGFGHMSPSTEGGQAFCILYSLLGVPLNGIVFAGLADLFASKIIERIEGGDYKKKRNLILDSCLYLFPGLVLLLLLPAVIFMLLENWSFLEGIYFAFIALTTIGFGDYVAGYNAQMDKAWLMVYRIGILIWIIFGLGYLLMVIAFIQRALRSKEVRILDRKMRHTFGEKMNVMQNSFIADIQRLRTVLDGMSRARKSEGDIDRLSIDDSQIDRLSARKASSKADPSMTMDMFLELAESILVESENDLENRMNHYNNTLTEISRKNSIDENDNAFRTSIFPIKRPGTPVPKGPRRASIWVSSTTPSLLLEPPEEDNDLPPKRQTLDELLTDYKVIHYDRSKLRRPSFMEVLQEKRRHSTDLEADLGGHRLMVPKSGRRQTIAAVKLKEEDEESANL